MQTKLAKRGKKRLVDIVFGRTGVVVLLLALQAFFIFALFRYLEQYMAHLFGGLVVLTAVMMIYVLNAGGSPSSKLSWCVLIAVVPVFGTLLYFFIRTDLGHRMEQQRIQEVLDASAIYVPDQSELMQRLEKEDRTLYNLAVYTQRHGGYPVYADTEATYFPLGDDAFRQMLYELEQAERFIFLEYFIVDSGYMWDRILEILTRKASRGVEVRLLYDGTCSIARLPYNYPAQLERLGIRCRVFSPLHPLVSTHYNNRDHRKILVVDGRVAFTGGINLADEYINRRVRFGHWKDTAVLLRGDAVRSFTLMFLQMWNAIEPEGVYAPYLVRQPQLPSYAQGYVIPFADSPLDDERVGEMVYLDILNEARDYVYIMTPYLILDTEMVTALCFAAKRGVDVHLVLPHIPDKRYAFLLARGHYAELIAAGVKIFEYLPGFVHAKVFLSDDCRAVVGTINLDFRSLYLHFECAAYLHGVPSIADIRRDFRQTEQRCRQISLAQAKSAPLHTRLAAAVLKVLAPLM